MSATAKPQGKTTYVASESDRTWPLNVQRALHAQSREVLNYPTSLALTSAESPVHNERCTPGSDGGARKPPGASRKRRRAPTIRIAIAKASARGWAHLKIGHISLVQRS